MDKLIKALALNKNVRVYIAKTTSLVNEAIVRHDLWPSTASLLGKSLTIAAMMGAMLKEKEGLTFKINGSGPCGNIVVDANSLAHVRGYVDKPHVHFSYKNSLDEATTLGCNGYLDVIKDLGLKEPFTSTTELQTGDLAQEFTYYFLTSEQTPSCVGLGCEMDVDNKCKICGGIIIQLLPNCEEKYISYIEGKLDIISKMTQLLSDNSLNEILKLLFNDDFEILDEIEPMFKCPCSKEGFSRGILTLGSDEIEDIIKTKGEAEIVCHYCNNQYLFNKEELEKLYKESLKWKKNIC